MSGKGPPTYHRPVPSRSLPPVDRMGMGKTAVSPPATYPKTLGLIFAADPFDPRFVRSSPTRELTPLGVVVNTYHWIKQQPTLLPAMRPIMESCRETMRRECPDTLEELDGHKQTDFPPVAECPATDGSPD